MAKRSLGLNFMNGIDIIVGNVADTNFIMDVK
jgi:hypothetical protein